MLKSIRYKLIILYFLLVLVAMLIIGIFITDQLEKYQLGGVRDNISHTANNIVRSMIKDKDIHSEEDVLRLRRDLNQSSISLAYQFYIIDAADYRILASTNGDLIGKDARDVLERSVILAVLSSQKAERDTDTEGEGSYKIKHMAFSFDDNKDDVIDYIIYGKASLDDIYKSLATSKTILFQATGIALFITIILGYLIAGSITVPINQLTVKAMKMAKGDFRQRVHVKSEDEIGQLGNMFNDLTEKLDSTLLEISSEKSKLNAIINHMEDALVAVDVSGRIIHHNPMFLRLLGMTQQDLQGEVYDNLIKKYSEELIFGEILSKTPENRESVIFENERKQILKASPAIFRDEYGRISGAVVVIQDITESQKLENMRKEFVANVSHELKTPITTIKSYSETLLNGAMEDAAMARHFVSVIEKEADRMSSLVKDLLQLSQMDYNNVQWDMQSVDIRALLKDCAQKLSMYIREKNQRIRIDENDEPAYVYGDRNKLEQVFINLISNAVKYTPNEGQISLSVKISGESVCAYITDSGIGIPPEDIKHIFDRFYRVDKGRSRAQGGTGLGLAIAKNIIEEHKGMIRVRSEIGKGSRFTVYLPLYTPRPNLPGFENM